MNGKLSFSHPNRKVGNGRCMKRSGQKKALVSAGPIHVQPKPKIRYARVGPGGIEEIIYC